MSDTDFRELHAGESAANNYMIKYEVLGACLRVVQWIPTHDLCEDLYGSNALFPFYYDATMNTLK